MKTRLFLLMFIIVIINNSYCQRDEKIEIGDLEETNLFFKPDNPVKVERIIKESDKIDFLFIGVDNSIISSDSTLLKEYLDYIEQIKDFVNICVLLDFTNNKIKDNFIEKLTTSCKITIEDFNRSIFLIDANLNSKWIRDYGPIFGFNKKDGIILYDNLYTSRQSNKEFTFGFGDISRKKDDISPALISNFLYSQGIKNKIVRTSIILQGGDIQFPNNDIAITSFETLVLNGGNREKFERNVKRYYSVKEVIYLKSLPGRVVKHNDMVLKCIGDSVFFLGKFECDYKPKNKYEEFINAEVSNVLEYNKKELRKHFPKAKFIELPMPSPLSESEYEKKKKNDLVDRNILELYNRIVQLKSSNTNLYENYLTLLKEHDLNSYYSYLLTDSSIIAANNNMQQLEDSLYSEYLNADDQLYLLIDSLNSYTGVYLSKFDIGQNRLESMDSLQKILNSNTYSDFDWDGPELYVYRTYLNFMYLNTGNAHLFVFPSYSASKINYNETIKKIVLDEFPEAKVKFVKCDKLIKQYGALHCISITSPKN